jgi:hypothetical protein
MFLTVGINIIRIHQILHFWGDFRAVRVVILLLTGFIETTSRILLDS